MTIRISKLALSVTRLILAAALVTGTCRSSLAQGDADLEEVHYIPCPVCSSFMNRVNFAHCSHVVVNICKAHGTWFDKDQLRRIVEFIRAGGMEKARQEEIQELEHKRTQLASAQIGAMSDPAVYPETTYHRHELGDVLASAAVDLISSFFFKR